jgi:hypothetical protein
VGSAPLVLLGPHAAHQHLLRQQERLLWAALRRSLDQGAAAPNVAAFHARLAEHLLRAVVPGGGGGGGSGAGAAASAADDPSLAAFGPLMLQHWLAEQPQGAQGGVGGSGGGSARADARALLAPSRREARQLPQLGLLEVRPPPPPTPLRPQSLAPRRGAAPAAAPAPPQRCAPLLPSRRKRNPPPPSPSPKQCGAGGGGGAGTQVHEARGAGRAGRAHIAPRRRPGAA